MNQIALIQRIKSGIAVVAEIVRRVNQPRLDVGIFQHAQQFIGRHTIFCEVELIGALRQFAQPVKQIAGINGRELQLNVTVAQKVFVGREGLFFLLFTFKLLVLFQARMSRIVGGNVEFGEKFFTVGGIERGYSGL